MLEEIKAKLSKEEVEGLEKYIQSETDKVRTKYTTEIKELEKYKPKEKSDAEKELEQKMKELESKQKEIEAKERQYKIKDTLAKNELPSDLAKYLSVGEEELETVATEIGSILNNHLMNNSYKPKDRKKNDGITKEQFKEMSYGERVQLQENSPELYAKLSE